MLTWKEFKNVLYKEMSDGYPEPKLIGKHQEENVYLSYGMFLASRDTLGTEHDMTAYVHNAFTKFFAGDYGRFYDTGYNDPENPLIPGREFGEYPSPYGETYETGAIMAHRDGYGVTLYFQPEY